MKNGLHLHQGDALLGLLVEQCDAFLEALLVGLPRLQQLRLPVGVRVLQLGLNLRVLQCQCNSPENLVFIAVAIAMSLDLCILQCQCNGPEALVLMVAIALSKRDSFFGLQDGGKSSASEDGSETPAFYNRPAMQRLSE